MVFSSITEGWASIAQVKELVTLALETYMSFIIILRKDVQPHTGEETFSRAILQLTSLVSCFGGNHCPVLPDVQLLKTIISKIIFIYFVQLPVSGG